MGKLGKLGEVSIISLELDLGARRDEETGREAPEACFLGRGALRFELGVPFEAAEGIGGGGGGAAEGELRSSRRTSMSPSSRWNSLRNSSASGTMATTAAERGWEFKFD